MTRPTPRLRIERVALVESRSPTPKFIRDIALHAGLNIVWAQELPAAAGTSTVERAGHGVGKSTFCLMLRAVLGDDGVAVRTMRAHLAEHYGSGGIAAEVLAGGERFAVFRGFGPQSFATKGGTIENLLEGKNESARDFASYVAAVGEQACLRHLPMRVLPVTGQMAEWAHFLCWIARDQALGLREYFEWRTGDATGLRRKTKDPPAFLRLALGLVTDGEMSAELHIARIGDELSAARDALAAEEQRGANVRGIVESQLRHWATVSTSLRMVADDLFSDSVEKEIERKSQLLEREAQADRATIEELDGQLLALAVDIRGRKPSVQLAQDRWQESVALLNDDAKSLKEIRERREKLLGLVGTCQYGAVTYSDCIHVEHERAALKLSTQRDARALSTTIEGLQARADAEKAIFDREAAALANLVADRDAKSAQRFVAEQRAEARSRQLGRGDAIRETLNQWQEAHDGPETERLRAARAAVGDIERRHEAARGARFVAQQEMSTREQQISRRMAKLAENFGARGRYVPAEERRPFQMLGADGDTYTVLEILLGDLVCAQDGAEHTGGAHPGVLVFDCPREREMGKRLYDRLLLLVDELCRETPDMQVIVTTTTQPPAPLHEPPTRVLMLSRESDDGFLLKRRVENLLSRATSPAPEAE